MEIPKYPMRINKYLALRYKSNRREVDKLIANKQVYINGKLASLGTKVNERDLVEVWRDETKTKIYIPYQKPAGVKLAIYKKDKIIKKPSF